MTVSDDEAEYGVLFKELMKVVIRVFIESALYHLQGRLLPLILLVDCIVIVRIEQRGKEGYEVVPQNRLVFDSEKERGCRSHSSLERIAI